MSSSWWHQDHTTGLLFIFGAAVLISVLIGGIGTMMMRSREYDMQMFEMGYCKTQLIGTNSREWHLCGCTLQGGDLTTIEDVTFPGTLTVSEPSNLNK